MKLKNFCPIRVGDILLTTLTTNPATDFLGTTWQEIPQNKFLKTGNTPLQQSGSNSIKLTKANLPTDKLQVESHSMTRGTMNITGYINYVAHDLDHGMNSGGAFRNSHKGTGNAGGRGPCNAVTFDASRNWTGSTSSSSPYTTAMGSGIAITINPEHIIIKAWKRLS